MIGPNVVQAIIDDTGNNWKGFPFLFALCTAASLIIWFGASLLRLPPLCVWLLMHAKAVDVPTGRRDAVAWAQRHRSYAETGVYSGEDGSEEEYPRKD